MSNDSNKSGGVGFFGLLTIVFITLKLTHVIAWSWWWVLAPFWIPLAFILAVFVILLIVQAICVAGAGR
jgi:hypothetical protein